VDRDRQLALYQAGVEALWPGAPGVRLVWHYLRFDERRVSTRSREQMDALLRDTAALVDRIEAETDWSPTESRLCDWCPYWDLCPLRKHAWALGRKGKEEASLLPHPAPAAEEAAAAVDEGLALLARGGTPAGDLDRVKERLLAYARSTGATLLAGTAGSASVRPAEGDVRFLPRPVADGGGSGGA
jgi:hypothetical protein